MGNCGGACGLSREHEVPMDDSNLYFFMEGHLWSNRIDEIIEFKDN